jgi:hypothetical protein
MDAALRGKYRGRETSQLQSHWVDCSARGVASGYEPVQSGCEPPVGACGREASTEGEQSPCQHTAPRQPCQKTRGRPSAAALRQPQGYLAQKRQPQGNLAHKKQHRPLGPPWPKTDFVDCPKTGLFHLVLVKTDFVDCPKTGLILSTVQRQDFLSKLFCRLFKDRTFSLSSRPLTAYVSIVDWKRKFRPMQNNFDIKQIFKTQ